MVHGLKLETMEPVVIFPSTDVSGFVDPQWAAGSCILRRLYPDPSFFFHVRH
jgi:hypothetical protein